MSGERSVAAPVSRRLTLVGGLLALAAPAIADPLAGRFGGPFSLTNHDGERVTDADFRGKHMLVYFGFTQCADLCPVDLPTIATALDLLGAQADQLQPLFITVDPQNDTPAVLKDYVGAFHPKLVGLTGTPDEIAAAAKAYRVHRLRIPNTPAQRQHSGHSHTIDHGSLTYLMGPDGKFLTLIPHGAEAARMAAVIRHYLR